MMRKRPAGLLELFLLPCVAGLANADATADRYERAARIYDDALQEEIQTHSEMLRVSTRVPIEYEAVFTKLDPAVRLVSRAAKSPTCDWEIDLSGGLNTLLPNTEIIRNCQRLLEDDLRRQLVEGDLDAISERLVDLYGMTRHAGPDLLITSLVTASMVTQANELLDDVLDQGMLDPVQAQRVLDMIKHLEKTDPIRLREAIRMERNMSMQFLEEEFIDRIKEGTTEEEIQEFMDELGMTRPEVELMLSSSDRLLDDLNRYWDDVLANIDSISNAELIVRLKILDQRIQAGDYGTLTMVMSPKLGMLASRTVEITDQLTRRRRLLEQLVAGELDAMANANAAAWYARAAHRVESADPEWWDDEHVRRKVVADLSMASLAGRCAFPYPEDYAKLYGTDYDLVWTEQIVPWWLPHLDGFLVRLMAIVDSEEDAGNRDQAVAKLAIALHMIRHLSIDPGLPSSVVAAHRITGVIDRIESMQKTGLTPTDQATLLTALREIPTTDAFGIQAATDLARRRVSHHLVELHDAGILPELDAPTRPDDMLYAIAWSQELVIPGSRRIAWPDALPGIASDVETLDEGVIKATVEDGLKAADAWSLEIIMPLEAVRSVSTTSVETMTHDGRVRLVELRRRMRGSSSSSRPGRQSP